MNYNYNQYSQYPYNYSQQQPQYQQYQQPQQIQNQYIPLTFVSGIEGAKAFIVAPNQTVYLRDSDSDTIYIKTANSQGRYDLQAYTLTPINGNSSKNNPDYLKISDFSDFKKDLENRLSNLEKTILEQPRKAGE